MPQIDRTPQPAGLGGLLSQRAAEQPEAQLLAAILDQVPLGVTIWHRQDLRSFRLVAANEPSARMTGVPLSALPGKTLPEVFPQLLASDLLARVAEVIATGRAADLGEIDEGHEHLFSLTAFPLPGERAGIALAPLRPGQEMQRPWEGERERFEVTLSSIGDAVIATDTQGRITFLNPVAAALTGWEVQQALGRDVGEVFAMVQAHTRQPVENPVARVLREGLVVGLANHTVLVNRSGQDIPIDDSGAPIRDAFGRIIGVVLVFRDIRERVRAEAAQRQAYEDLQQARRQLEVILNGVADGIVGYDRQGQLVYANRTAAHLLGYPSVQALLDAPLEETRARFEILNEDGQPLPSTHLPHARVLRGEPQAEAIIRYRVRATGEEKWSFARAAPVRDSQGQIQFIIDIFHDITEERRSEIEHLQLAAIVQSSDDAIIGKDLEGIITSWNPGAERMFGYSSAEAVGHSITLLFPPERQNESRDIMRRLRRGERIEHYETERLRKDGTRLDVSVSVSPLRDRQGRIVGAADITRDITDRRQRERAERFLSEASAALSASLDYETTLSTVARLAIPALADWCTVDLLDEDDRLRRLAVAHIDPERERWAYELYQRYPPNPHAAHGPAYVIRTGQAELEPDLTNLIAEAARLDPEYEHLLAELGLKSFLCVPLIAHGTTLGAISFVSIEPGEGRPGSGRRFGPADLALAQELARRAATAIDNARLYAEAQQAVKLRDQFMSVASHELKTPLTSVLGFTQLLSRRLERSGALTDRDRRTLQVLHRQGEQLNRLIGGLLDFSRIQSGHLELERSPLDLCALVRRIIEEEVPDDREHPVECRTPRERLMVDGDAVRLEQVAQNLLQNALKYSPKGSPIEVRVERRADAVEMAVRDQGIGIPAEALPHIFERFYRASNVDASHVSGLGIGLFVVREIVMLHGGTVEVTSQEGQGSTFTVRLPLLPTEQRGGNHAGC